MAEFPAMPLWIDRYLGGTRHLSRGQHGAYLLLLMEAWSRPNCSLPDDDQLLARLTCSTPEEWAILKPVIMAFWRLDGRSKEWAQKGQKKERAFLKTQRTKQRDRAISGWKKRKSVNAAAMPPTPTPTVEEKREGKPSPKKGSRIPESWTLSPTLLAFALSKGLTEAEAGEEADQFKDYWRAASRNATKLDWSLTWQQWVRNSVKRNPHRRNGNGQPSLTARLVKMAHGEDERAEDVQESSHGPDFDRDIPTGLFSAEVGR